MEVEGWRVQEEEVAVARSPVTCAEAGARGGRAVVQRYGLDHLRQAGQRGGQATARRHPGMARVWGKLGVRPRKQTLQELEQGTRAQGGGDPPGGLGAQATERA